MTSPKESKPNSVICQEVIKLLQQELTYEDELDFCDKAIRLLEETQRNIGCREIELELFSATTNNTVRLPRHIIRMREAIATSGDTPSKE